VQQLDGNILRNRHLPAICTRTTKTNPCSVINKDEQRTVQISEEVIKIPSTHISTAADVNVDFDVQ